MTLKMKNIVFIIGILVLFFTLWGASIFADAPKGFTGFAKDTGLSPDDETLVFSYYHGGDAWLYTVPASGGKAKPLAKPKSGNSYFHPKFSPNGEKVAFIKQWREEERPYGQLMMIDRSTGEINELTDDDALITEAAFSPDGESLFFLKAAVYKNYSSIASKRPHDLDIYRLDLDTEKVEQITNKNAYSISDIAVTPDGEQLMYKSEQVVFLSLEDGSKTTISPEWDFASQAPIISSPVLSPNGEQVVFAGVAAEDENGTFIYEGFRMNIDTGKTKKITSFHESVTSPVFFNHHQNRLIVTVNRKFAKRNPDYEYWKISMDGDWRKRIDIQMPEDSGK